MLSTTKLLTLKQGADYISARYFDISYRTLESFRDLPRRRVNKMRRNTVEELDRVALARIEAANAKLTAG